MDSGIPAVLAFGLMGAFGLCGICTSDPAYATSASLVAAGHGAAPTAGPAVIPTARDTQTVRLRVEGMTCGGCAISARVVLERLDGVHKAEVRYREQLAVVTYDGEKVTAERMIEALRERLEYVATVIDPIDPADTT